MKPIGHPDQLPHQNDLTFDPKRADHNIADALDGYPGYGNIDLRPGNVAFIPVGTLHAFVKHLDDNTDDADSPLLGFAADCSYIGGSTKIVAANIEQMKAAQKDSMKYRRASACYPTIGMMAIADLIARRSQIRQGLPRHAQAQGIIDALDEYLNRERDLAGKCGASATMGQTKRGEDFICAKCHGEIANLYYHDAHEEDHCAHCVALMTRLPQDGIKLRFKSHAQMQSDLDATRQYEEIEESDADADMQKQCGENQESEE